MRGNKPYLTMEKIDMKLTTPNGTLYETVEQGENGETHLTCHGNVEGVEIVAKAENHPFPSRTVLTLTDQQAERLVEEMLDELQD